mgnify:CR=1 FL=1
MLSEALLDAAKTIIRANRIAPHVARKEKVNCISYSSTLENYYNKNRYSSAIVNYTATRAEI